MAKEANGQKTSARKRRNDITVKIDRQVAGDAVVGARANGVSLAEYLSEIVRPIAKRDVERWIAKRSEASR